MLWKSAMMDGLLELLKDWDLLVLFQETMWQRSKNIKINENLKP